ncbi:hypothetical protein QW131_30975 [Roseibium salinum]|nr:hypothetical protein [Roseibium salinum]
MPNWQIEPELAVTLAFGSLVGQLDERICDRMSRIAHEFARGGLVARNPQLAARWYRLAADLGDFNAAWDLAKLHLEADGFEKGQLRSRRISQAGGRRRSGICPGRTRQAV